MKLNEEIQKSLKEVDPNQEVFTEQVINKLSETIEERANELYKEKFEEDKSKIYEQALEEIDKDHAEKLEEAVEKLDNDHSEKLEKLVEMIDEDHSQKLQDAVEKIKEKYEDAQIDEQLVDKVSEYLDTYMEEALPESDEVDKARLESLEKLFNEARQLFMVSDDYVQSEVSEALQEAKNKIDEDEKEINKLMLEKTKLSKQLKEDEAQKVLESNIDHLTESEKTYVRKVFKDSDADEISEEAINEAVEAYRNDETRHNRKSNSNEHRKFIKEEEEEIDESKKSKSSDDKMMDYYKTVIQKSK